MIAEPLLMKKKRGNDEGEEGGCYRKIGGWEETSSCSLLVMGWGYGDSSSMEVSLLYVGLEAFATEEKVSSSISDQKKGAKPLAGRDT